MPDGSSETPQLRVLQRLRRARRWLLLLLSGVAIVLLPWTAYLSATLPSKHITDHWDIAWAGFDLFEAAMLIATVFAILRRSTFVPMLAAVAGTALICDAWFDVITAGGGRDLVWALLEAFLGELPLAALCYWLAFEVTEVVGASVAADPVLAVDPRPTLPPDPPAATPERAHT